MKKYIYAALVLLMLFFIVVPPSLGATSPPTRTTPFDYLSKEEQAYVKSMRGAISEAFDHPRHVIPIPVPACHHHDPAVTKMVGRHENPAVPGGEDHPLACGPDKLQAGRLDDFPTQAGADQADHPIAQAGNHGDLESVQ